VALISVVIPAYNGGRFIAQTIRSVQDQTFGDWELVVVDDGSADATASIVEGCSQLDPRVRLIRQENRGEAAARNRGLASICPEARFVIFFDHDDVWEPAALAALHAALVADPDAVGAQGLARFIDANGEPIEIGNAEAMGRSRRAIDDGRIVDWPGDAPTTFGVLILTPRVWTPGQVLLRREVVDRVGPFDAVTDWACDLDYWLRVTVHGHIVLIDDVVINYRRHAAAQSNHMRRVWRQIPRIYRKLLASPDLTAEQRTLVHLGYRLRHRENARLWLSWARDSVASRQLRKATGEVRHAGVEVARYLFARAPL
jgi:glycosyltransferase involved in cell wall biosynthesis